MFAHAYDSSRATRHPRRATTMMMNWRNWCAVRHSMLVDLCFRNSGKGSSESTNTVNRRWLARWLTAMRTSLQLWMMNVVLMSEPETLSDPHWWWWWWWWGPRKGTTDNQFDLSWHHHRHHRNGTRPTVGKLESVANLVRAQSNLDGPAAKWAVRMSFDFLNWLWWNLCYDSYRYSSITFWRWSH